jgi:hypothetical protein
MAIPNQLRELVSETLKNRLSSEESLIMRAWEDDNFKQTLLSNPKAAIAEAVGESLPDDIEVEILEETSNKVYFVIPNNPASAMATGEQGELSEEALEQVAGGVCVGWSLLKRCFAWSAVRKAGE